MRQSNYSRLPITRTLANSNLALIRTNINFPWISFIYCNFTLGNSNLPLTRSNFHFPSSRFLYNFILDNSSHLCQIVISKKYGTVVYNFEFILKQSSVLPISHYQKCVSAVQGRSYFIKLSLPSS